jgi:hypothetical protein
MKGASRIAFLPDSPDLKDDVEHALEFMAVMHSLRGIGCIKDMFESGFGVELQDLSEYSCINDITLLAATPRFFYVAGRNGINTLDAKHLDGFVVFTRRELERVVGMTTNTLFGPGRDISDRVVYIQ